MIPKEKVIPESEVEAMALPDNWFPHE